MLNGERPEGVALLEDAEVEASVVEAAVDAAVDEAMAVVDESAGAVAIGATGETLLVTADRGAEDAMEATLDDGIGAADEAMDAADDTGAEEALPEPIESGATDPPPYTRDFWTLAQFVWMVAI